MPTISLEASIRQALTRRLLGTPARRSESAVHAALKDLEALLGRAAHDGVYPDMGAQTLTSEPAWPLRCQHKRPCSQAMCRCATHRSTAAKRSTACRGRCARCAGRVHHGHEGVRSVLGPHRPAFLRLLAAAPRVRSGSSAASRARVHRQPQWSAGSRLERTRRWRSAVQEQRWCVYRPWRGVHSSDAGAHVPRSACAGPSARLPSIRRGARASCRQNAQAAPLAASISGGLGD